MNTLIYYPVYQKEKWQKNDTFNLEIQVLNPKP